MVIRGTWVVAVGLLVALIACGDSSDTVDTLQPSRGFILISLDTVSAQHLSLYGYDRQTTPFLDQLAQRATVFDRAFVQLPGTLPSHMSMFTGLYPDQHGVFPPDSVLAPDITTLPEVFMEAGFRTIGHTDGGFVSGRFGFSRGFDEFNDERIILWTRGEHTFNRGLKSLRELPDDQRFFLFVHTYAAHDPYNPPRECRGLFWQGPPPEGAKVSASAVLTDHNKGVAPLSEEIVAYYRSQYDGELRCLDTEIGHFFAGLQELGLDNQVTVIITADHGEEFLQHGMMAHEQIYNETLQVPLLILTPGLRGGRRVDQVVQSIDLAPTLLELAGLQALPGLPGRSLVPLLLEPGSTARGEAFTRSFAGDRGLYALGPDGLFHVVTPRRQRTATGEPVGVASALQLWVEPGPLELEARSYLEPTRLRVEVDGEVAEEIELNPEAWTPVEIALPRDRQSHLLRLSADTCATVPGHDGTGHPPCISFHVKGLPARRVELYRADVDPFESRDLSQSLTEQRDALLERLEHYRLDPVSAPSPKPLEPEVEEQLRALGYLQ